MVEMFERPEDIINSDTHEQIKERWEKVKAFIADVENDDIQMAAIVWTNKKPRKKPCHYYYYTSDGADTISLQPQALIGMVARLLQFMHDDLEDEVEIDDG